MVENGELKVWYCLANGWAVLKKSPKLITVGASLLLLSYVASVILFRLPYGYYLALMFQLFIGSILTAGWWYFCLMIVRGNPAKLTDIFSSFRSYSRVWITSVVLLVMFFIGLVLLVIPGILVMLKYDMSIFIILDSNLSPLEALKMSAKITKGSLMKLLGLFCIWFLINLLLWICAVELPKTINDREVVRIVLITIPRIIGFLLISPWLTASLATAYDVLYKHYKSTQAEAG